MDLTNYEIIVFYDSDCGFCNHTVAWCLKNRKKDIYFCALQSASAQHLLEKFNISINLDTIYVYSKNKVFDRFRGVCEICRYLKVPYPIFYYSKFIVPTFIGDYLYKQIAKRRHKIASTNCTLPSPEERKLFLS